MNKSVPTRRATTTSIDLASGEVLVYESDSNTVHSLSGPAALVWRACGDAVRWAALPDDAREETVAELVALGLVEEPAGVSRRTMLKLGAATAAVAGVVSLALPDLVMATSPVEAVVLDADGTLVVPAGVTVSYTLVGGGGAGGGSDLVTGVYGGGNGGDGAVLNGTFTNHNSTSQTLAVTIGAGGGAGSNALGTAGAGGSGLVTGGDGGSQLYDESMDAYSNGGIGGGGGGSSAVVTGTSQIIVVAGGGGGGAGGGGASAGGTGAAGNAGPLSADTDGGDVTTSNSDAGSGGGGGGGADAADSGAGGAAGSGTTGGGSGGGGGANATPASTTDGFTMTSGGAEVQNPGTAGDGGTAGTDGPNNPTTNGTGTAGTNGVAYFSGVGISGSVSPGVLAPTQAQSAPGQSRVRTDIARHVR